MKKAKQIFALALVLALAAGFFAIPTAAAENGDAAPPVYAATAYTAAEQEAEVEQETESGTETDADIVYGEVDGLPEGNPQVTAQDALMVLKASAHGYTLSPDQTLCADVDLDDEITAKDALTILQYTVHKIPELPWVPDPEDPDDAEAPEMLDGDDAEDDADDDLGDTADSSDATDDDLYDQAVSIVRMENKATVSLLQRRLNVGYARAARIMELLEENGIVGPFAGSNPREVLPADEPDDVEGSDDE